MNAHFLTGAVSGAGSLSGGSWSSSFPLANLLKTQPGRVARSTNATEASTQFVLDLGSSHDLQMFAFVNHNLTQDAPIRIRVSDSSDGSAPTLDVTFLTDKASIVFGSLPWGAFPWDGVEDDFPGGYTAFYLHDEIVSGRYVLVNISDESNADGYVQIGCFLAGVPFVPDINVSVGATVDIVDDTRVERGVAAGLYAQQKPKRRRIAGQLQYLSESEALGDLYELQNHAGRAKGVLFVLDPEEDNGIRMRRTVYGSLTELGAFVTQNVSDKPWSTSFTLEELI